jgi:hypothetical protein
MAFLISPGVSINEIDLSTYVPAVATTGGVLAGPFTWGPASVKTLVDSEGTLVKTFGEPSNATADVFFTADSFLQYGNNLNVVRVLPTDARNAAVINDGVTYISITNPGAGYVHVPTLTFSSGSATATATVDGGEIVGVTITDPGSGYTVDSPPTITVAPTNGDTITILAVLTPTVGLKILNETDYLANYATGNANAGEFCAKYAGALGNGIQVAICDDATQFATWTWKLYFTSAPGTSPYVANLNGSGDQLHIVVVDNLGVISGAPGTVLETFGFVSKAVDAQNAQGASIYYPTVLDRTSNWVRWLDFPSTVSNWGTTAANTAFDDLYVAGTAATLAVLATNAGIVYTSRIAGINGNYINIQYINPGSDSAIIVAVSGSGTSGSHYLIAVTLAYATGAITSTAADVLAAINGYVSAAAIVSLAFASGGDGSDLVTAVSSTALSGGTSSVSYVRILEGGSDGGSLEDGQIMSGYDLFNVDDFSFGLILTASYDATVVEYLITEIAETRMDSVVFLSPPSDLVVNNAGNEASDLVTYRNTLPSSSYAFMTSNWLYKYDKWNDVYRYVPDNGDIAGLCVRTDQTRDPWFSPAGLNRGNIKGAINLAWNPKQAYRDVLYQSGINPVISLAGQGVVLFGDKTMLSQPSAFDRINVRRLFIVIEQAIAIAAKYVLFELNDAITRAQFVGLIDPYLRDIQGRRGLYAYQVVCDSTNNTPDMIDMNQFQGDIYLQPTKSINFIQLNFIATRTGVDFSEIIGQF